MAAAKYTELIVFVVALAFGLIAFSQIAYPLVTLVPRVRRIMQEDPNRRSALTYLLLLAPGVWTVILTSTIILVFQYYRPYVATYLIGLGIVLVLVTFNVYKRNRKIEEDFIFRLKRYIRLSKEESLSKKYPRDKMKL
ncbi:MAG: hypothetical protein AB1640_05660 [bacterium]